jgi:hypothetical protein
MGKTQGKAVCVSALFGYGGELRIFTHTVSAWAELK